MPAGDVETVLQLNSSTQCNGNTFDLPDISTDAFRSANGTVNLLAADAPINYRNTGPTLSTATNHDCTPIYTSAHNPSYASLQYQEWISGVYTEDGTTVYALVHNEWYPELAEPSRCSHGESAVFSITLAKSTDGGATYSHPSDYIVRPPFNTWNQGGTYPCNPNGVTVYGSDIVSGIIKKDSLYYAFFLSRSDPAGTTGSTRSKSCVMRTSNLADASSWQVWTGGSNWSSARTTAVCADIANHFELHVMSVTYNNYLGKYIALLAAPILVSGVVYDKYWYSTSDNLTDWTVIQTILTPPYSPGGAFYGSFLDPNDSTRNFESIGREPYLYVTHNHDDATGFNRDLIRQKIRFTDTSFSLSYVGGVADRVGQGDAAVASDGMQDGVFTLALGTTAVGRTVTSISLAQSTGGGWDTTPGNGAWALGIATSTSAALYNASNGSVNFIVPANDTVTLFASNNSGGHFNPGQTYTATVKFSDGGERSTSVIIPSTTVSLSYVGGVADRVGQGDAAITGDGVLDGMFSLAVANGSGRTITSVALTQSTGGVWDTTASNSTWVLGVAANTSAPLYNAGNGTVSFVVPVSGALTLFGSNSGGGHFNPGQAYTVVIRFSNGEEVSAAATVSATPLSLSFVGKTSDRVGQGDGAISADGTLDGTLTAMLGNLGAGRVITHLRLSQSTGGAWDTTASNSTWVLGAASGTSSPLYNTSSGTVYFTVPANGSITLFGSDNNGGHFNSGQIYTLTVKFSNNEERTAVITL